MAFRHIFALIAACLIVGGGGLYFANRYYGAVRTAATPDAQQLYHACVDGLWPDEDDAQQRAQVCSRALQTGKLKQEEVALARLTRGVARTVLGNMVASFDDYQEALKHYDGAINPTHRDALDLFHRAKAEEGLGQTDRALADYDSSIRLDPKNQHTYLARGTLLARRARDYGRAIGDFSRTLELEPHNVTALLARGDAYSQLGEFGPALADIDQAVNLSAGHPHPLVVRGVVRARQGKPDLAMQDYDAALKINEKEPYALMSRAAINAADGKHGLAIRDLDASIAANENNALAFYNRGYAHFALGEYPAAIADYDAAIKLDGDMGLAHLNRCLTRALAGETGKDDFADCDTALKLMPLSPETREARGVVMLKQGQLIKAIEEFNAALDINSTRAQALYGRAVAECRLYRTEDCKRDRTNALALDADAGRSFKRYGLD